MTETLPEPDRLEGTPHPRDTRRLIGQGAAEAGFLEAFVSGRLHHGWMLTGPRGVGKATLAWRIARFLLATPDPGGLFAPEVPQTLDVSPDHPVARRMAAGSESRLFVLRRPVNPDTGRLKQDITVDEVRRMKDVFRLSAPDGGRRVAIIDCADELNTSAANALLKLLEEPPEGVVMLLVTHQPARLLPTIRSRCRVLRLPPLGAQHLAEALDGAGAGVEDPAALAELAGGSVGAAVRLAGLDGQAVYARLIALAAEMPGLSRPQALSLAEMVQGKGAEGRFELVADLVDLMLARLARRGAIGHDLPEACPGEARALARLSPDASAARLWAEAAQDLGTRLRRGRAVNLDAAALVLDLFLRLDAVAGGARGAGR
jgi:DNA polymerase III subunit delta'